MSATELVGKRALVTGATDGIGRAIAVKLAEAGAAVLVTGRRAELGRSTVETIEEAGGQARFVAADLSDLSDVRTLADEAGDIDVLVNNAGIYPLAPTLDQTVEMYEQIFNVNVRATYFLTAALVPRMIANGRGVIINISSVLARVGLPSASVYSASKAAIDALTRTWAVEFSGHGIRVNTLAPGMTHTEMLVTTLGDTALGQLRTQTPLARTADPEEIAEVALFLASARASYLTGSIVTADGGYTVI